MKEWKFRREKPLNETRIAEGAECAHRQQEMSRGAGEGRVTEMRG